MAESVRTAETLGQLSAALAGVQLDIDLPAAAEARAVRTELIDQIDDYLIPRLARLDAPLLAVLGGSTGSGKSTITNTLARSDVSAAGVLRPTTRAPVLICHPDDIDWFGGSDLLGAMPRATGDGVATGAVLQLKTLDTIGPGLGLIDAPDIDSVEEANRVLATQLLGVADLWLFATTAVRYADAVPWEFLRRARQRGTTLALIINRIPAGATDEIEAHLRQMLNDAQLGDVPVFSMEQTDLDEGRLPEPAVRELRAFIDGLADDAEERARVVRSTLAGTLASVEDRASDVMAATRAQDDAVADLRRALNETYARAREDISHDLAGGTMLRSEVLDRWQELIGMNELMRAVQSRLSWARDRIVTLFSGRTRGVNEVAGEITNTVEQLLVDHADQAALRTVTAWRALPGGRQILASDPATSEGTRLDHASPELRVAVGPAVRAWQDDILELVRERGQTKRNTARILAFGLNSVGVALMIVIFSQTGGLTGGEVAVASGTATVSQTLLNALFGEQAVRELASEARRLLLERVGQLLDTDANRFRTLLWSAATPPERTQALISSLDAFAAAEAEFGTGS